MLEARVETLRKAIGGRVRHAREDCGLTQKQLGQRFDPPFSHSAVCDIEKGRNTFSVERLAVLAKITGKPIEYFYTGIEVDAPDEVAYRIRDARMIAGLFLDWLDSQPYLQYLGRPVEVGLCRRAAPDESGKHEWRPYSGTMNGPGIDALVAEFLEWCQEK